MFETLSSFILPDHPRLAHLQFRTSPLLLSFDHQLIDLIEKSIDKVQHNFRILNDTSGLQPAMDEAHGFDDLDGGEFIDRYGIELFADGRIDDDQMMEVLLVVDHFDGQGVREQLHRF